MQENNIPRNNEELEEDADYIITLTLEEGGDKDFLISAIFSCGNRDYVALIPQEQAEGDGEVDLYIYRYDEDENGEPIIDNIEDDDEYMRAADEFEKMADEYSRKNN